MTQEARLAITGSTGYLGGLVARGHADAGITQRLLARTPEQAPELPGATAVASSYASDETTANSLADIDVLFMVSASESADRLDQHRAFIDAAVKAGVGHIVYTSFFGATPDSTFTLGRDHWATEQHIIASGMAYTFLRDNFYIDFLPTLVGEDGVIRGPGGEGRVAAVTRADVARVAITVLSDPAPHAGATYNLTGPDALTFSEIAQILTEQTGKTVTFHNETIEEAYASRRAWDAPQWQYDAWVSTYSAIAANELVPVSRDVHRITGNEPETLQHFLRRQAK